MPVVTADIVGVANIWAQPQAILNIFLPRDMRKADIFLQMRARNATADAPRCITSVICRRQSQVNRFLFPAKSALANAIDAFF